LWFAKKIKSILKGVIVVGAPSHITLANCGSSPTGEAGRGYLFSFLHRPGDVPSLAVKRREKLLRDR
jgi:hypothetical protein